MKGGEEIDESVKAVYLTARFALLGLLGTFSNGDKLSTESQCHEGFTRLI